MANIYFGAYVYPAGRTQTGDWNNANNWYLNPGVVCNFCGDTEGTPANRVPTVADTVITIADITTGYSGGNWSGPVQVYSGKLNAGTYSGTVTLSGSSVSATLNGPVIYSNGTIAGGTVNGALSPQGASALIVSGGVINGAITAPASSGSFAAGQLVVSGGTFNTAIPQGFRLYTLTGGTFDRDLVLGQSTKQHTFVFGAGFNSSRNITINAQWENYNLNLGWQASSLTISGGTFSGNFTLNKAAHSSVTIDASAVYNPPAVQVPAIKSGNFLTFNPDLLPVNPGFTDFNPVVNITGTSNDILGAGLL